MFRNSVRHTVRLAVMLIAITAATPPANAQHAGDVIIGANSNGQLVIDPEGFVPDLNYFALPVGGVFFPGWADSNPGFDHLVTPRPEDSLFPLSSGALIDLEIVNVDPAFQVVVIGNPPLFLDQPGESTLLGDHTLHEHITFHINADSPQFDPDQCVWHATFQLVDDGSTEYDTSTPMTFRFTNVPLETPDGDFDENSQVDTADHEAFAECLSGPNQTPTPNDPSLTTCEVECLNAFDFDGDLDVDLQDYVMFSTVLADD